MWRKKSQCEKMLFLSKELFVNTKISFKNQNRARPRTLWVLLGTQKCTSNLASGPCNSLLNSRHSVSGFPFLKVSIYNWKKKSSQFNITCAYLKHVECWWPTLFLGLPCSRRPRSLGAHQPVTCLLKRNSGDRFLQDFSWVILTDTAATSYMWLFM